MRFLVSGPVSSIWPSALALITPRGPKLLPELRILRIIGILGLLLGIEIIEVAEGYSSKPCLVGKCSSLVSEMVLAELPGGVTLVLQQGGDGPDRRPASPPLRRAGRP
jgi:xanthosine utilization system XapX-like protein